MQLLPTIIILALLAFFVILTLSLFLWYWQRNRTRGQKRYSVESSIKPPRKLTLRDGKAIPHEVALETPSDRDCYSVDLQSPDVEKEFEYDVEKGFTKPTPSKSSKRASRHSLRSLLTDRGQQWTPGRPPWLHKVPEPRDSNAESESKVKPPKRSKPRDRSRSIPRPSLIHIERRGSSQTPRRSSESHSAHQSRHSVGRRASSQAQMTPEVQQKRRGMDITESLFNAYKGPTPWTDEIHPLPASSIVMPGPERTVASSIQSNGYRWSVPATASFDSSIPQTASFVGSSRAVSDPDPIRPPAPLFSKVDYSPRVTFAPTQDANRKSFLSMTPSGTSSTSSEHAILGPKSPPPLLTEAPPKEFPASTPEEVVELKYNEQSRPVKALSAPAPAPDVLERVRAFGRLHRGRPVSTIQRRRITSDPFQLQQEKMFKEVRKSRQRSSLLRGAADIPDTVQERRRRSDTASIRPPSIEINIPHFERGSLSFFDSTPTPPQSGRDLPRGPSVMSDRSAMTIASSEISSNWTIGKAELVNIYPSLADDEEEDYESIRESMKGSPRRTPPYAKVLRSKYGQYPRNGRNKALPLLPRSPLSRLTT
ncbi:uncharacterized protein KY384_007060 [Bacidia gigantensis]|uniref:uncharacterized protein n=1 Tax=Bacidia gigantensis TaxID=2732470 RepID=UPI001D057381|nr:uncharacterized protein KY384_007060 [Bacidia gigantensis]KAG8528144.1 hypothetical protein KY384_007060 [Bacidia gigantensis]